MSEFKRLADLLLTNDLDTALRLVDKQYQARIGLLEALIVTLVPAGYGGIEATGTTVGNSLGAGFDTLDYIYDQNKFADPRGVTQDFANGNLLFNTKGVWSLNVTLEFDHNESNSGRSIEARFFNEDTALGTTGINIPIARNQPGTLIPLSILIDITDDIVGDRFVLQIGNGSTVTSIVYNTAVFEASHVGELEALV